MAKTWLYAAGSFVLGAWIAPLVYNAGKALAEVTWNKELNGFVDWLGKLCNKADFTQFYTASILLASVLLFLPWVEWLYAGNSNKLVPSNIGKGQPLACRTCRLRLVLLGVCFGFVLLSALGLALNPNAVWNYLRGHSLLSLGSVRGLVGTVLACVSIEFIFRGVVLGIFLRKMRHVPAILSCALLFAAVFSMVPPAGMTVADPDAPGTGFELLGKVLAQLFTWKGMMLTVLPLFSLGVLLGYARWRSATLWLPIGIHIGWALAKQLLDGVVAIRMPVDAVLRDGVVPVFATVFAISLAYFSKRGENDEPTISV